MIRFIKWFFLCVVLFISGWILLNLALVRYGASQLKGQLAIVLNTTPVSKVLLDENVPDSVKARLNYIQAIRTFTVDSLGLKESKNYTTFFNQHGKPLLMVLTASKPYKLESYQWDFPFLGEVGYKGFFNFKKGREEEKKLQDEGYDTDYGSVSAWSTLGWLKDPILSSMLYRSDGQLAELIIHELTHSTLYVKDQVDFNENLASFIGEQGAIRFLSSTFGKESPELSAYIFRLNDYQLFSRYMIDAAAKMSVLYSQINDFSPEDKLARKDSALKEIVIHLDTLPFHSPLRYKGLFDNKKPNNAYLLNFIRYDAQKDSLKKELEELYKGNFKLFLAAMKDRFGK